MSVQGSEGTEEEKAVFEKWLREVWRQKDELMETFRRDGKFGGEGVQDIGGSSMGLGEKRNEALRIPLELRSKWEILPSLSYFLPVIFGWMVVRLLW